MTQLPLSLLMRNTPKVLNTAANNMVYEPLAGSDGYQDCLGFQA